MDASVSLATYIKSHPDAVGKVIDFNAITDCLYQFDFTANNKEIDAGSFTDTLIFSDWINEKLKANHCKYGTGGYMEHRTLYARSPLFDAANEPRRLHLGIDIWAEEGTPVYSPLAGKVHSFNNNDNFGDYGPTIILEHDLDGLKLYSLYGHLSTKSLEALVVGQSIHPNQQIAGFGGIEENGHWPPHLHFQLMFDMEGKYGDYPGVCRYSEKDKYLKNIPDPQLILQFPAVADKEV
jgi:murein DD-endopeptidase MepM/ murein hydrolase activator NlpD